MATVKTMFSSNHRLMVNITGAFDSSDETDVVVVDRSALTGPLGVTPSKIRVNEITWTVGSGFDYVLLEWNDTTDEVIEYLQGQGYLDFRPAGGKVPAAAPSAATDGDILLTTSGGAANDTYSIYLDLRLKE